MEPDQTHNTNSEGRPEVLGPTGQAPSVDSPTPQRPQSRRRSKLALASLILGLGCPLTLVILIVWTWFAIGDPGIIILVGPMAITGVCLGIAGLWQIKRSDRRLRGATSAIGGIVVSCGTLVLLAMLVQLAKHSYDKSWTSHWMNGICSVAVKYSYEHNGELPDPERWAEQLASYLGPKNEQQIRWPSWPSSGRGIAMNQLLVDSPWGKDYNLLVENAADPGRTVMFFEAKLGKPAGGPELIPEEPAYSYGYIIGFLDRRARLVPKDQLDELIWTPRGKRTEE